MKYVVPILVSWFCLVSLAAAQQSSVTLQAPPLGMPPAPVGVSNDAYVYDGTLFGVPQANLFPGSDMCVKLYNANVYAVSNGLGQVDATYFNGTMPCSMDPIGGLVPKSGSSALNLVDNLGAVHIQTTVPWTVTRSGFSLHGMGPMQTWLEYTGTANAAAVLSLDGSRLGEEGVNSITIDGMFFSGRGSSVTDAFVARFTHRSEFRDVSAWGATNCGIHTLGAVTDTLIRPKVSGFDALYRGTTGSTPQNGICLDSATVGSAYNQTTDGTVVDAAVEGVTGAGWLINSANSMTFTSGTSESNGQGLLVNTGSKFNTFISADFEGNSAGQAGVDVEDNGQANTYIGIIAASACSSCTSVYLSGGGGQYVVNGFMPTGASGGGYSSPNPGFLPANSATAGSASPLPAAPAAYLYVTSNGQTYKIPAYHE